MKKPPFKLVPFREFDPQPIRHRKLCGWLRNLCQELPQCRLVDWSCGSGIGTKILREQHPGWRFFMADIADKREHATDEPFALLDFDTPRLPLEDGAANVVVCSEVFEHVHNLTATIREIRRVLAPGGFLVGSIPNFRHLASRYSFLRRGLYRIGGKFESGGHVNYIMPEFLTNFVSDFMKPARFGGDVDWISWVDFVSFRRSEEAYRRLDFRGLTRESPRFSPALSYDFLFAYRKNS